MVEFVPSAYMRKYIEETGWNFSDLEKAALVHNLPDLSLEAEFEALRELAGELSDEAVIVQIEEYISRETERLEDLSRGGDDIVFSVISWDDDGCKEMHGLFRNWENARKRGRALGREHKIGKHLLLDGQTEIPESFGLLNPFVFDEMPTEELICHHGDGSGKLGEATISPSGELMFFWLQEPVPETREEIEADFDTRLFTNAFVVLPNPFEIGDIVRCIPSGQYPEGRTGVVAISQQNWKRYLELAQGNPACNFFDSTTTIDFINDNGEVYHDHVPTTVLEPYKPGKDDPDGELLDAMSHLLRRGAGLEWFLIAYNRRKNGPGKILGEIDGFTIEELSR